ncbi:MAG: hypothetical protein NC117_10980, partial [Pseudoflavonifractor sp.]|nr:hypothetical protein [Pseudoflavonifractor sp.]
MNETLSRIMSCFRNIALNSVGVTRSLHTLLLDGDVSKALELMQDRDTEIDEAIREYHPQTHTVMRRRNKFRKNDSPYITEKLPRTRQRYINEVELFFLLGRPIVWTKKAGDDGAYTLLTEFMEKHRFDSRMREAKRLAGAET